MSDVVLRSLNTNQVEILKTIRRRQVNGLHPALVDGRTLNALFLRGAVYLGKNRRGGTALFITDTGARLLRAAGK